MMAPDSLTTQERVPQSEINTGSPIRAVAFTADGKILVSADKETVRVWRLADNLWQQVGSTKAKDVRSLAVSRSGRWIAAGKSWGEMTVWERKASESLEELFTHDDGHTVTSVDFSPGSESIRLVAASGSRSASVWDVATRKMVFKPIEHAYWVVAAKFSPQGDRIATATFLRDSVRVYNSSNGTLLADIPAQVTTHYNTGLLWSNDSIFVLSNNKIKQFNPSTKSLVSEWLVPDSNYPSIASPRPGEFITYSSSYAITLLDTSTLWTPGTQLLPPADPLFELSQDAHSIAVSPDGGLIAIGGGDGTITFESLSRGTASGSAPMKGGHQVRPSW